ncbi:hypothetical protein MKY59_03660 [Paenibacillus sp. FSL W8-0426]|uniref:hypothetical protein n=1 Tax=Paenibacillus sp. FSL W8-0426 TaxID=2921714 RepID=UPI0030D998DC
MKNKNKMNKWTMGLSSAMLVVMLAGCGTAAQNTETASTDISATAAGATAADSSNGAEQTSEASEGQTGQEAATEVPGTMLMGKIKSIDGQAITLYKSSQQPGEGGTMNEGKQPPQDAQSGNAPAEGEEPPAAPEGGEGQGLPPGEMNTEGMFTDETVEVALTDSTKLVSMVQGEEGGTESEISPADLKEGDIVNVTLDGDTWNALEVRVGGGFSGGMQPPGA